MRSREAPVETEVLRPAAGTSVTGLGLRAAAIAFFFAAPTSSVTPVAGGEGADTVAVMVVADVTLKPSLVSAVCNAAGVTATYVDFTVVCSAFVATLMVKSIFTRDVTASIRRRAFRRLRRATSVTLVTETSATSTVEDSDAIPFRKLSSFVAEDSNSALLNPVSVVSPYT